MYLIKTPRFVKEFFPQLIWEKSSENKVIYLTFDDGPHPEITPMVLEILKNFEAKATFFFVGENISKYRETYDVVQKEGHSIGSHTYNHLNGWATDNTTYFNNVKKGASEAHSRLFRPPYGRIKPSQVTFLTRHYQIVMWDVLSGDFDKKINGDDCYLNVIKHGRPGSIVVFHDSDKSKDRMLYALPKVLEYYSGKGFSFLPITDDVTNKNKSMKEVESFR
ncbi:polysaccharide deacetylase family protein [Membranihabitans maritimus]|uniref:polysaccharide deacetylase family protein n=1 Tax=Membranihabitans maritimus TaxID=2904244 RepID=UPI001F00A968|nr:polysaccharide deacetylase family protein [Membranihabitans maritimus]